MGGNVSGTTVPSYYTRTLQNSGGLTRFDMPELASGEAGYNALGALGGMAGGLLQSTDTSFGTIGGGALKGAAAGAALGPLGIAGGALLGGIGGVIENRANNQAADLATQQQNRANIQNSLATSQQANGMFQLGGNLNNITQYNGLQHQQGGLPLGNTGNEVEGGETRGIGSTEDYIYSDKLKVPGTKNTFAEESKKIEKKYTGTDNDSIALESKNKELDELSQLNDQVKAEKFQSDMQKLQQSNPEAFQQMMQQQVNQQQNPQGLGLGPQDGRGQQQGQQFATGGELPPFIKRPATESDVIPFGSPIGNYRKPGQIPVGYQLNNIADNTVIPFRNPAEERGQMFGTETGARPVGYGDLRDQTPINTSNTVQFGTQESNQNISGAQNIGTINPNFQANPLVGVEDLNPNIIKASPEDLNTTYESFRDGGKITRPPQSGDISRGYQKLDRFGMSPSINTGNLTPLVSLPNAAINRNIIADNPKLGDANYGQNIQYTTDALGNIVPVGTINAINNNQVIKPNEEVSITPNIRHNLVPGVDNTEIKYDKWKYVPGWDEKSMQGFIKKNPNIDPASINNWQDPTYTGEIMNTFFTKENYPKYQQFMDEFSGKPYDRNITYEDHQNKVINKSVHDIDKDTNLIRPQYGDQTKLASIKTYPIFEQWLKGYHGPNAIPEPVDDQDITLDDVNIDEPETTYFGDQPQTNQTFEPVEQRGTRPFVGDYVTSGISALPNIGTGIASAFLGRGLDYKGANAEQYTPDFVDPTRAIQEVRDQYGGAKDQVRQLSGGAGNYLANLIGTTAGESKATAGIHSKYDNINAGIANQADQFNAQQRQRVGLYNTQIGNQEQQDRIGLYQNAIGNIGAGLNTGIGNYIQSKRDANMMNIAGGENYYYERVGPVGNQIPVRVVNAYGYETFHVPGEGVRYREPGTNRTISAKEARAIKRGWIKNNTKEAAKLEAEKEKSAKT